MPNDTLDMAVARYVRQTGMATAEQLLRATQTQTECSKKGEIVSLAEALVRVGVITPAQREAVEKKAPLQGGVQQLQHYKLLKKIGEGGMGVVYLGEDSTNGKRVAIKVLPRSRSDDPQFLSRFHREAEAARTLHHENIVRAYAVGEDLGYHFYVMEYCEGDPLDHILKSGGLPWLRATALVLQVASGLKHAHDRGIIHRDVKPANVFLAKDGSVKILDLGLSKNIQDSELSFRTASGAVLGTPHYISPEQAQGEKTLDGRADIYSLGAMYYHLLTGTPPFEGVTLYEILSKQVNAELPNPQDLNEDVPESAVHVLRRMMAKAPSDRYANCGELIADLEQVIAGKTPQSRALGTAPSTVALVRRPRPARPRASTARRKAASRSKLPLIAGGAAFVAILVVILVLSAGNPRPERPAASVPAKPPPPPSQTIRLPEPAAPDPVDVVLKRVSERLRQRNPGFDGKIEGKVENGVVAELSVPTPLVSDLSPIRELTSLRRLRLPARSIETTGGYESRLTDLEALRGLKLTLLFCGGNPVRDLSPLQGMPLTELDIGGTRVSDLSPLIGMPLRGLYASGTLIQDLSPLRGLPLDSMSCTGAPVRDHSPLRGMKLKSVGLNFDPARDTAILQSMPVLNRINGMPAEEFWRKHPPK